jgi:hypothetical protein
MAAIAGEQTPIVVSLPIHGLVGMKIPGAIDNEACPRVKYADGLALPIDIVETAIRIIDCVLKSPCEVPPRKDKLYGGQNKVSSLFGPFWL